MNQTTSPSCDLWEPSSVVVNQPLRLSGLLSRLSNGCASEATAEQVAQYIQRTVQALNALSQVKRTWSEHFYHIGPDDDPHQGADSKNVRVIWVRVTSLYFTYGKVFVQLNENGFIQRVVKVDLSDLIPPDEPTAG